MNDVDPRLATIISSLYRVAQRAIIVKDGRLLMVKEDEDDYFSTPGGGLDYGEALLPALKRELFEEIGLAEEDYEIEKNPILISQSLKAGIPRVHIYYKVTLTTGEPKAGKDTAEIQWCPLEKVIAVHGQPRPNGNLEDLEQVITLVQKL